MVVFEIITDLEKIRDYYAEWDQLFNTHKYEISTSFEWTQALLATSLLRNDVFLIIVLRDSGEIVGFVPLVIRRGKNYGMSLSHVFPIAELYNTHSDLLLDGSNEELIKAFIVALFHLRHKWDVFRIKRFVETNPALEQIERYLANASIRYSIKREEPSFFIRFDNSYDDYLKGRSANFRYDLKRKGRKIQSIGEVKYCGNEEFGNVADAYRNVLFIEENSWKHKHGTAITSVKMQEDFFRELCRNAAKEGSLHLRFLYINEEPIAYNIGLLQCKRYYLLKLSYHERFKQFSPATLLMARTIEELIREGTEEYDFTGEPYEYEGRWTENFRWHKSLLIYNRTFNAKMYYFYNRALKNIRRKSQNENFEYHDPKKMKG